MHAVVHTTVFTLLQICLRDWVATVSLAGNQCLLLFLQIWLLALLVYMARASAVMRLSIAAGCALLTAVALPPRLWKPQLRRLGLLGLLLFVFTTIGSGWRLCSTPQPESPKSKQQVE